ncbi:MAG TPA: MBL fold metallo-hydrolase [Methanothrix sp.]|nr:MBL fold metallo-hydrolase [Methanothrix sp.]HPT19642.1 MBL fold metallo-hydrolase [Methanothrix sp.]
MIIERIVSEGLAHYSYLIGDRSEAIVIDPRRDVDIYLKTAAQADMRISHILETHRNEDYFVGSMELAGRTGGQVWHADSQWDYQYGKPAAHGQRWKAGRLEVEALATPGHTPGSFSYLLRDPAGFPWMLFSGDALFAGDVGRIDLLGPDKAPEMAGRLFESIFERILPLGDDVILCPAHGSGSVCAEAIAERLWTTIGLERKHNPRLKASGKEDFVSTLLASRPDRPPYFRRMERVNLEGRPPMSAATCPQPLDAKNFLSLVEREDAQIIDLRQETAYSSAHIPGSQFIWLDGLAGFAGWFAGYDRPIVLVGGNRGDIEKAKVILQRMGFDSIPGYLAGGMLSWHMAAMKSESLKTVTVQEICRLLDGGGASGAAGGSNAVILDVRSAGELEKDGRIMGAQHIHITEISARKGEVPRDRRVYIFCGSGLRSMVTASFLKAQGWTDLAVILGGMAGWRSRKCPIKKSLEKRSRVLINK